MPHVELPQAEFKVVMLGDTNAGKTSLVLRFAEGYYRDGARSATVGAFFITKRLQTSTGITCKIQIWDTAGQEQFRAMAPMYYKNAAAAIICYDVTSPKSFSVMREWLDELHQKVPAGSIVIAIAATKSDLAAQQDVASTAQAEQLAATLGALHIDTSAKTNSNVHLLFQRVAERVLHYRGGGKIPPAAAAAATTTTTTTNNNKSSSPLNNGDGNKAVTEEEAEENGRNGGYSEGESHFKRKSSPGRGKGKGKGSASNGGGDVSVALCDAAPVGCGVFTTTSGNPENGGGSRRGWGCSIM